METLSKYVVHVNINVSKLCAEAHLLYFFKICVFMLFKITVLGRFQFFLLNIKMVDVEKQFFH